jgi:DNA-binding MarR family transcriptional regulator
VTMATAAGREAWRLVYELLVMGETAQRLMRASSEVGLSPGHLKSMMHIEAGGGVPMRDLAEHWHCDASYVTSIADVLEERGFARRLPHPSDRRIKMLALTDEGVAARDRAYEVLFEPPPSFDALTPSEQRQFRDLLRKIADADPEVERHRGSGSAAGHLRSRDHALDT